MLKLTYNNYKKASAVAAAFGRLCVETTIEMTMRYAHFAAAFGRLCVETDAFWLIIYPSMAAAFGRLCVETNKIKALHFWIDGSRLRAAVC